MFWLRYKEIIFNYRLFIWRLGPEIIELVLCSPQLSMNFSLLINVKMPTIVGILTFISMINTTALHLKARKFFIFPHFSSYDLLNLHAHLSCARKKFYNLEA